METAQGHRQRHESVDCPSLERARNNEVLLSWAITSNLELLATSSFTERAGIMKTKYTFASGSRLKSSKANVAGRELDRLTKVNGGLTAENVVDSARKRASPLHDFFEWSDSVAAQRYRLEQARHLMRCVVVMYDDTLLKTDRPIRAFIAFETQPESLRDDGRYVAMHQILTDAELRELLVDEALTEHIRWEKRYAHLKEFAAIVKVRLQVEARRKKKAAKKKKKKRK